MKIEEMNRSECCGCESCANVCPKNCISMIRDAEGFAYPKINHEACVRCGKCDSTCPSLNAREIFPPIPKVFVAVNPDEKVRRHSSSGGAFTALSEIILKSGGIIFGAGFDENWAVTHTSAENLDELENLRGSKYVQSKIGKVYRQVKSELENGRKVLFSGVPCQCAGLKFYLGKDYENLLTVSIICHGTPSPYLWESYIDWHGRGHDISRVNFRSKRFGWANNHVEITFKDCGFFVESNMMSFYVQGFLTSLTQRPACSKCKFRFPNLNSDLTLGDAWGIQNFAPELFDNRGASLIIVHTQKGSEFLMKTPLYGKAIPFEMLVPYQPLFFIPTPEDSRRQNFFRDLAQSGLPINTMQKYFLQNPAQISNENQQKIQQQMRIRWKEIVEHYQKN